MDVADKLCHELFHWIEKQEEYADHLMALAEELEEWRRMMTAGQLVGNTATIVGSAILIGTGIATLMTGGLASPLLAAAAGATEVAGFLTSVTCNLLDKLKSSETMKKAAKTAEETEKIQNNIKDLQRKLSEECESLDLEALQYEITVRLLGALARMTGRNLSCITLERLLMSDDDDDLFRCHSNVVDPHTSFSISANVFLTAIGFSICINAIEKKGARLSLPLFKQAMKEVAVPVKNVLKGFGQAVGGGLGLVLTLPDFIDNCEELIKNKHHTEASSYLKTKAKEIREAVQKLKTHLNELQEMLRQIPEMECHMDLSQKMLGSETYTQGIICIKYKQSKKQDKSFFLLCNRDIGTHRCGFTDKHTSDVTKTNRQKLAVVTKSRTYLQCASRTQLSEESSSSDEEEEFCLPTITLSNVRSLPNKMKEIKEMIEYVEYFNTDLIVFTETWLNRNSPGISLNGYVSYQQDRDPELTGKKRGGGLILFVKTYWSGEAKVTTWKMTKDYEIMVVHIIPHKPTKKVKLLTYIIVYVPGHVKEAAHEITKIYNLVPRVCPVFLLGDFNKCEIICKELEQYVTCPTRGKNILDKCYGNVPGAYISYCRPPLGLSDHNVIYLIPKDKTNKKNPFKVGGCKHDGTKPKKK